MKLRLIAAIDADRGMAKNGSIPWKLPTDTAYYRDKVKDSTVLLGWNTYSGMRTNPAGKKQVVLTSKPQQSTQEVQFINDLDSYISELKEDIWVLGGGSVFAQTIKYATELYLTRVEGTYECDVFFPEFENEFERTKQSPEQTENGITFRFEVWSHR